METPADQVQPHGSGASPASGAQENAPPSPPSAVAPPGETGYPQKLARLVYFGVIGLALALAIRPFRGVLVTLFVSLLIAYVLDPLIDRMQARRIPRGWAIGALLALGAVATVLAFILVVPPVVHEAGQLAERLGHWLRSEHANWIAALEQWTGTSFQESLGELRTRLQELAPEALRWVGRFASHLAGETAEVMSSALNIAAIPLFAFYFLRDFDRMAAWVFDHVPPRHREAVHVRANRVHELVGGWLRGQIQVALALAGIYAIGLGIVGLPLWFAVGLLAGLLSIVPYLGFAVGFTLATLIALAHWTGWGQLAGVVVVFAMGQGVEGYILTPRLVGEKVGLSAVSTLIAILLGGEAFGLLGIVLAVPVAGIAKMIASEGIDAYRASDYFRRRGAAQPPNRP